jgi:hypothetical protein
MNAPGQSCLPSERRKHLSLLAAEDLVRFEREATLRARGRSIATWAADVGFWLVYGGGMVLVAYIAFCAPRP